MSHSTLSPSGADRWWACPASVSASSGIPDKTSFHAAEGTFAHEIRAECLELGLDAYDFVGQKMKVEDWTFEVTEEVAGHIQPGVDRIRELGGDLYVEKRVDLSRWLGKDQGGTLDAAIITKKRFYINDFKFGEGEVVEPRENKQLLLYALGFWWNIGRHASDATEFVIMIDQPRVHQFESEWSFSLGYLQDFGEQAKKAARRTRAENLEFNPGPKQCKWCRARPTCDAFHEWNLDRLSLKFKDLDEVEPGEPLPLENPKQMTPERMGKVLLQASSIRAWLQDIHDIVLKAAIDGDETPYHDLGDGRRPPRKWADPKVAEEKLSAYLDDDEKYVKTLISPTEAEKRVGKSVYAKHVAPLVAQAAPSPVLVPKDSKHKRRKSHVEKFKNLDATNP